MKEVKKEINADYSKEPKSYGQWRENAGVKDTKLEKEFYNTPLEEMSNFINNHKKWWNNR